MIQKKLKVSPKDMVEILNFIFRDFATWLGTVILCAVIFGGLGQIGRKYN